MKLYRHKTFVVKTPNATVKIFLLFFFLFIDLFVFNATRGTFKTQTQNVILNGKFRYLILTVIRIDRALFQCSPA